MAEKPIDQELTVEQSKDQLLEIGKKRGVLVYEEIADKLGHFELDSEQMDEFYETLASKESTSSVKVKTIRVCRRFLRKKNLI